MKVSPQADAEVAMAVMQEAMERLAEFMEPIEAAKIIAAFGLMGLVERGGYVAAKELAVQAVTAALDAQLRAGGGGTLGPS
jgi:3-phosphoglycerate kinase